MPAKKNQKAESFTSKPDLGVSLMETIKSDVAIDLAEVAVDSLLKDGLLKDIPILSTIIGVGKFVKDVRDFYLIEKVRRFLLELEDVSRDERNTFFTEMQKDISHQRKVGNAIVMLLDRLDDLDKSVMIAKIFKAYVRKTIDFETFIWYSSIVDRLLIRDLQNLFLYMTDQSVRSGGLPFDIYSLEERLHPVGLSRIFLNLEVKKSGEIIRDELHTLSSASKLLRYELAKDAYRFVKIQIGNKMKERYSRRVE